MSRPDLIVRATWDRARGLCDLCGDDACAVHSQVVSDQACTHAMLLCPQCFVDPASPAIVVARFAGATA